MHPREAKAVCVSVWALRKGQGLRQLCCFENFLPSSRHSA